MHLVEVTWRKLSDVFSEGGECRKTYSVIFFFQEGSVHVYGCVCLCGIQWVVGGEVAGDFSLFLTYTFLPK